MKARLSNAASVALLFWVFIYSYRALVAENYDYFGMGWRNPPAYMLAAAFLMNVSIAYLANPVYRRPSQLFLVIQFLVVFLPASVICLNVTRPEVDVRQTFVMVVLMYVGMLIQTLFSEGRGSHRASAAGWIRPQLVFAVFAVFAVIVLSSTLFALGNLFSLSTLETMYEQREVLDEKSVNALLRYGISWLVALILPALFICAIRLRGWRRVALGAFCIGGYFVLFGITATKTTMFAPIIVAAIYGALRSDGPSFILRFAAGFTAMLGLPVVMSHFEALALPAYVYASIVNFRIFAVPQTLYVQYLDFFSTHPHTLGSHINLVSLIVDYPFDAPVFLLIGDYYYPGSNLTANAGTWGQDGIAGFGLVGILIMSLVFTATMRLLDSAAAGHDARFVGGALAMLPLFVSNASLFTTMLSGGLLIAIALLYATRRRPVVAFNSLSGRRGMQPKT